MLIDKALTGATSCRRFAAPHHRREGLVSVWPSSNRGRRKLALFPAAVEATPRMTYKRKCGRAAWAAATWP